MKDIFEQNSVRPNDQLLGATPSVPNGHRGQDQVMGEAATSAEKSDAEGMVHYLLVQSKKPALMIDSKWTLLGESCTFPTKQAFVEAAQNTACVVHQMTCADQGGTRHLLFIGKSAELKDADYLECIPTSLPHLC